MSSVTFAPAARNRSPLLLVDRQRQASEPRLPPRPTRARGWPTVAVVASEDGNASDVAANRFLPDPPIDRTETPAVPDQI
ncbi:hypothetical protein [Dactylosporangium sp. CA-233914]|uniref:hypothetical protein n=1 Tax=Dactylosporangium sp. CA-233914 TaxID=3239934 RepID=UPI003D91291B